MYTRVWWTPGAIERLAKGETVQPFIGQTIDEQRANDLFRWLRDFGPRFGWRQTGTLTKLQQEANQGAIGIIVAGRGASEPRVPLPPVLNNSEIALKPEKGTMANRSSGQLPTPG